MPSVRSHWKMPVPLPRLLALRHSARQGDDDADQARAHALQQPSEDQEPIAVRERDDGNAGDKEDAARGHEPLAPHPVREDAREERRDDAAQQHRGHDEGELARIEMGRGLEVGQGARDDPDVDSVEESAQARHEQEESVVVRLVS